ncbi:hypothetical protein [Archangium sp.]|uniref:hypothetical protein n=1 Tax=Archangium sp. TaxID=1872627 RepID=UPI002D406A1B|nr:hypothetical protein [Archangium sp.]HYO55880.1 hypothetical protein [Archangium sp.]
MSFAIHIDAPLAPLLEELPSPVRVSLQAHLERIAETAEFLPPEDPRWSEVAQLDGDGLRTYVAGCCVRLHLLPGSRKVVVEQIGRIRVSLPSLQPLA